MEFESSQSDLNAIIPRETPFTQNSSEDASSQSSQPNFHSYTKRSNPVASPTFRETVHLKYNLYERGECPIIVQRDPNSENYRKDLAPDTTGRSLQKHFLGLISDVQSSGFGKLRVIAKSPKDANFLLDEILKRIKGLITLVPSSFVTCQGIIRGVSHEISEAEIVRDLEILGSLRGKTKAVRAFRLNRKVMDHDTQQTKSIPSKSI